MKCLNKMPEMNLEAIENRWSPPFMLEALAELSLVVHFGFMPKILEVGRNL